MTAPNDSRPATGATPGQEEPHRHGGHGWMMIACCIPMLVIAVVLVATGVASPGLLVAAIACTVMMAMMMGAMGHGGDQRR